MRTRVSTGGRLHVGFLNLSLAHDRLYGSIGVALSGPRTIVEADRADSIDCSHEVAADYSRRSVDLLGVPGASVRVEEEIPRHVGLGSGTQLALAVYAAIAHCYDRSPEPRAAAPGLDRGGRSGVGVAVFESGGFVIDAGHPTERFTAERPPRGGWTVPPVSVRSAIPENWRFVLLRPDVDPGRSGPDEDRSMRRAIERAEASIADEISAIVTRQLLPAVATEHLSAFGQAVGAIGRLNGTWYADEQGGVYRPPVGALVDQLTGCPALSGVGQSSWGPALYGVTDIDREDEAQEAALGALSSAGLDGDVTVTSPRNHGAVVETPE